MKRHTDEVGREKVVCQKESIGLGLFSPTLEIIGGSKCKTLGSAGVRDRVSERHESKRVRTRETFIEL